ncbi:translation initiation factor IF-2-like [Lutra lutra]|uniref:translation initiation factor IF-2-like n=1 Tax=Lutra lutra TaxID=9657 RepID=UPI001FD338A9|nr:translation initiation factor IF-2-like [Lutra lutra]
MSPQGGPSPPRIPPAPTPKPLAERNRGVPTHPLPERRGRPARASACALRPDAGAGARRSAGREQREAARDGAELARGQDRGGTGAKPGRAVQRVGFRLALRSRGCGGAGRPGEGAGSPPGCPPPPPRRAQAQPQRGRKGKARVGREGDPGLGEVGGLSRVPPPPPPRSRASEPQPPAPPPFPPHAPRPGPKVPGELRDPPGYRWARTRIPGGGLGQTRGRPSRCPGRHVGSVAPLLPSGTQPGLGLLAAVCP